MNVRRNEKTNIRIATILCAIFLIIFAMSIAYVQVERKELVQQNSEYLSVIEEYSIEYSELEDKVESYVDKIQTYQSQIEDYKDKLEATTEAITTTKKPATTKPTTTKPTTTKQTTTKPSTTKPTTTETSSNSNSFKGNITAYCGCSKCCGKWATNDSVKYGATGMKLTSGYTVASDYYPMGTILYIEGYGEVKVADRFGAGHGQSRIDIYFDSHSTALQWGRQYRNVSVVS